MTDAEDTGDALLAAVLAALRRLPIERGADRAGRRLAAMDDQPAAPGPSATPPAASQTR